jgi:hypothetical protein
MCRVVGTRLIDLVGGGQQVLAGYFEIMSWFS